VANIDVPVSEGSTSSRYPYFWADLLGSGLEAEGSYRELVIFARGVFERLRRRKRKNRRTARRKRAPRPAPTPMPIFAPVLRPEVEDPPVVLEPAPIEVAAEDEEVVIAKEVLLLDVNDVMGLLLACVVEEEVNDVVDEELVVEGAELDTIELLLLLEVVLNGVVDGVDVGVVKIELGDLSAKKDMVPPLLSGKKAILLRVGASLKATIADAALVQLQGEPASRVEGLPSCVHSAQTFSLSSHLMRPIQGWSVGINSCLLRWQSYWLTRDVLAWAHILVAIGRIGTTSNVCQIAATPVRTATTVVAN
jgi:hypothetical protein